MTLVKIIVQSWYLQRNMEYAISALFSFFFYLHPLAQSLFNHPLLFSSSWVFFHSFIFPLHQFRLYTLNMHLYIEYIQFGSFGLLFIPSHDTFLERTMSVYQVDHDTCAATVDYFILRKDTTMMPSKEKKTHILLQKI